MVFGGTVVAARRSVLSARRLARIASLAGAVSSHHARTPRNAAGVARGRFARCADARGGSAGALRSHRPSRESLPLLLRHALGARLRLPRPFLKVPTRY